MSSLAENWRCGQARLAAAGIDAARLEARLLLEWVSGCTHADLLRAPEQMLAPVPQVMFAAMIERRAAGEPLAYLTGEAEFRGRIFQVSPAVLIPRADTEVLVEQALEICHPLPAPRLLDLGTGSGIVAISLALECPQARVGAVDLSQPALDVARNNAGRLGAGVEFIASDWFSALAGRRYDLIVSNPPYIAAGDPHLQRDGLPFEPQMALSDGNDGLGHIRRIVTDAPLHLEPGGWLLFEHGYDQGKASRNLLAAAGFKSVFTKPDLSGIDRVSGGQL